MNARTAGSVDVRQRGGRLVEPLHARRAPASASTSRAGVVQLAAGRDAHVDGEAELVGHDVARGAAVRERDGDGVVEL